MLKRSLFLLCAAAAPCLAQAPSSTSQARMLWQDVRNYLVEAANDAPESVYAFRPASDVRNFGEIIAHVAGAQKMFCALALGEKVPAEDAVEQAAKTKGAIVAALEESNGYCERAYAQSDAATSASIGLFGQQRTKLYALLVNTTHDNEHYGNIVTYLRMNKIVPPSSKPRR